MRVGERNMRRKNRGFTLIEVLVIGAVMLLVIAVLLPGFVRSRETEREEEVKSNIHAIQIALERYAVDAGGFYPYMLYGGDYTDTFAQLGAPVNPDTGMSFYMPPEDPAYQPFPGDFDALIQYGYLSAYPFNPFRGGEGTFRESRIMTDPAANGFGPLEMSFDVMWKSRTNIWIVPFDRSLYYVRRLVGGKGGDLMWDVSEGQRHAPWPVVIVPPPEPSWTGYVNPIDPASGDNMTARGWSHQFHLTPGNFYYYAVFQGLASYSTFVTEAGGPNPKAYITGFVTGYRLCGYGGPANVGDDVYNLWGDFKERSLLTVNEPISGPMTMESIYVGPDGRPDGVIISVDSGLEISCGS